MTVTLAPDDAGLARAARLLAEGELVAFPTETVYGLGADARNGRAVAAVFEAKGRPPASNATAFTPVVPTSIAVWSPERPCRYPWPREIAFTPAR